VILGLDIGGTKTALILGTPQGEIRWRKQFPTAPARGFDVFFQELSSYVRDTLANTSDHVDAISVSIGGPLNVLEGIVQSPPNLPGWINVPLKHLLKERFALPVYVEHDGNAGALAEYYFGAGKGHRNIIFLTMGTGLGAGLIFDGRLYRGTNDTAGEIGHIRIAEDGPLCYGKAGSLEGYGSGTGIAKLAHIMFPEIWDETVNVLDVYSAWKSGSAEARQVFNRAAFHLGRGFAMMIDLLNPECIILGGLGMRIGDAFLPKVREIIHLESLRQTRETCAIVPAHLGEHIGDVASLCAALDQGGVLQK
jgi:glucokinase